MELLTAGYEGRTLAQFVRLMSSHEVDRVVDVRARPQSHKPGFSARGLFDALLRAGISYDSDRALGSPDDVRARWRSGDVAGAKARFRRLVRGERGTRLELLVAICRFERVCILCFEAAPEDCHRSVIADEAARIEPRLSIVHL
ncbi:MAG TPA: DUF488 domain-containing protein [Actinomycetota bacterium]|jgi:uncharacterized protein (DUF488 family)